MLSNNCSILLIDDDADVLDAYTQLLEQAGYHVSACNNPFDAREQVPKDWPGIVLSDVCMPGCSGIDLMTVFHQDDDLLPILLITGHGDVPTAVRTLKLGAFDFLEKPVDAEALADAIEAASRVSVEASQGALPKQAVEQILAEMSPREHEITELLKQGLANHDIAERLDLSDRTVQGHRNNIYKKLRVHNLKQFLTVLEGG